MVNFKIHTQIDKASSPYQFHCVNWIWTLMIKVWVIEKFCFPQKFSSFFLCILQKFKTVLESYLSADNTDDDNAVVSCESQQSGVCILNVASDCI